MWRTLSAPSDEELMWQAMQQTHQQVRLPNGAALVERQATPPGVWTSICLGVKTGCPRDERTYSVDAFDVSAQRLRDTLAGLPAMQVAEDCLAAGFCSVSTTIKVNDHLSFVLRVDAPRRIAGKATIIGVRATPK